MPSARLRVFCVGDELTDWVRALCHRKDLGGILFRRSARVGLVFHTADQVPLADDAYRLFLFPVGSPPPVPLTLSAVHSRRWGWVDVDPGQLHTDVHPHVLTFSTFVGEDFADEPVHPAKYVRWLKRRLKGRITSGVTGRNVVYGGAGTYHDLHYTAAAAALYRTGVVWKQFVDGNVVFEPAATPIDPDTWCG